ncbi:peptidyl-prolyl cis-trans isomerase CYP59 [Artemisia annua]|uniref:Peptidyl-prolyl cis-trans isomerase n=1 Tax=Artemisia annua TaxID=35608 RepID=A0A2U1KMM4_ARTAN|nr:peptidyl-prolyl cis-trans isomerase CYP59 [Artemisia annua]
MRLPLKELRSQLKVVICKKDNFGNIVVDLHSKRCPLTCKNFLNLCKIKYYNGCLFHTVEKDFIAQKGDLTGTACGVDSIFKTVFGEVAEGFDILAKINEAYVDYKHRPYKNICIKHTRILEDSFEDQPELAKLVPDASPEGKSNVEVNDEVRLEYDWVPMDEHWRVKLKRFCVKKKHI